MARPVKRPDVSTVPLSANVWPKTCPVPEARLPYWTKSIWPEKSSVPPLVNRPLKLAGMAGADAVFTNRTEPSASCNVSASSSGDSSTPHGRLMLTVLGGLAEFERELIIARTGEDRTRAKARGVKFGRPTALTPHQRQEAIQRLANGEAQADVARSFNVSQATISRLSAPAPFEQASVGAA
jgi:hypothetical protein